eukprot:1945633-Pyramimonas_sp.AAC.1
MTGRSLLIASGTRGRRRRARPLELAGGLQSNLHGPLGCRSDLLLRLWHGMARLFQEGAKLLQTLRIQ